MSSIARLVANAAWLVSLSLYSVPAVSVVYAHIDVTSSGVTQNYLSTSPVASTLSLGGSQAGLQFASTPGCVGLACTIDGPAMTAPLAQCDPFASANANVRYSIDILGAPAIVPILVSGRYAVVGLSDPPTNRGGTNGVGTVVVTPDQGTRYSFRSSCYNYRPEIQEQGPAENCGSGVFSGSFTAMAGRSVTVYMDASIIRFFADATLPAASAFIDPYFEIDPIWAATHPGYSLSFDPGVGNGVPGAVSAVPEPESLALLTAGLLVLGMQRRRVFSRWR